MVLKYSYIPEGCLNYSEEKVFCCLIPTSVTNAQHQLKSRCVQDLVTVTCFLSLILTFGIVSCVLTQTELYTLHFSDYAEYVHGQYPEIVPGPNDDSFWKDKTTATVGMTFINENSQLPYDSAHAFTAFTILFYAVSPTVLFAWFLFVGEAFEGRTDIKDIGQRWLPCVHQNYQWVALFWSMEAVLFLISQLYYASLFSTHKDWWLSEGVEVERVVVGQAYWWFTINSLLYLGVGATYSNEFFFLKRQIDSPHKHAILYGSVKHEEEAVKEMVQEELMVEDVDEESSIGHKEMTERLNRLYILHEKGDLTDAEFEKARARELEFLSSDSSEFISSGYVSGYKTHGEEETL